MRKVDYAKELGVRSAFLITNLPPTGGVSYRSQSALSPNGFLVLASDEVGVVRELARIRLYEAGFPQWDRIRYREERMQAHLLDIATSVSPSTIQWPRIDRLIAGFMEKRDWRRYFDDHVKMIEEGIRNYMEALDHVPEQNSRSGLLALLRYIETISAISSKYLNQYQDRLRGLRERVLSIQEVDREDALRTREIVDRHAEYDPLNLDLDEVERDVTTLATGLVSPTYRVRINRNPFPPSIETAAGIKVPIWQFIFSRNNG